MLTRRRLLTLALAVPFIGIARAAGPQARRIAVLDWGLTELLLSLGITPLAVSAPDWYRRLIALPALPTDVVDIGLLFQPNLETLYALKPDLIVITPGHMLLKPQLERIAPTLTLPTGGIEAYQQALLSLGQLLHRDSEAHRVLSRFQQACHQVRDQALHFHRPIFLATPVDQLHMRVYGAGSLAGDVLAICGLKNGWQGKVNSQGEALVELVRIGSENAVLVLLAEDTQQRNLVKHWQKSLLWQRLPLTAQAMLVPPGMHLNASGALVSATRIAGLLSQVVSGGLHD